MNWLFLLWGLGSIVMRVIYFWVNRKDPFRLLDEIGFGILAVLWPLTVVEAFMAAIRLFLLKWEN